MKLLRLPPLLLALSACAAPQQETRTAVPEGINDSFLAEDADVDRFAERWELESREVYANRDEILATLQIQPGETVADSMMMLTCAGKVMMISSHTTPRSKSLT